jgi:hypothetical protein
MAVQPVGTNTIDSPYGDVFLTVWGAMGQGDTAAPFEGSGAADRSVQIEGTFGAGGSIAIQGSNDGANYRNLTNAMSGNTLSGLSSVGIVQVAEVTRYIKPVLSGGDNTTSVVVTLCARRSTR